MIQASGVIICLGYILGLLLSAVPLGGFWVLALGLVGAIFCRKQRFLLRKPPQKTGTIPYSKVWLIAGLVGLLASWYLQLRVPQPRANDISQFVLPDTLNYQEQLFIVRGEVATTPRVTRNQRGQFLLEVSQLDEVKRDQGPVGASKGVTGKLYVTVPLLQATGLYPGQQIAVTGTLYKPKAVLNPGGFDFQKFLKQEGIFAGLNGQRVNLLDEESQWGWWKVRERILRSQVRWLGVPEGPLLSAMVLGSKAVDLPYDIRDTFLQVGLAHALAASGFQTSLILGVIQHLTKRVTRKTQIILSSCALLIFLGLTGFLPPVVRAVIMGFAALIGLGLRRKVKQLGALLVSAVLMLLVNPLWIWDLGFQLSFLATLGLIVTVPPLMKRLEWLPPMIAPLIAVPLAGAIWTLPLLLHLFGVVQNYSLLANILTTPLISIVSLGGMVSALVSLIIPELGSTLASLLYYPTHLLIEIAEFFTQTPGNTFAVGSISAPIMVAIYILLILTWLVNWWQKRWLFAGFIALSLVFIPIWHSTNTLFQVTVLANSEEPVLVIQDKGSVTLINSGHDNTGRFTIVPFLQQQGVNQINWAIASDFPTNGDKGWLEVLQRMPIQVLYDYSLTSKNSLERSIIQKAVEQQKGIYQSLSVGQTINTGTVVVQLINGQIPILQMQILGQNWLLMGNLESSELRQLLASGRLPRPQVLWCPTASLKELVVALRPQVVIATQMERDQKTLSELTQSQTKLFFTGRDGAIRWTPKDQFESFNQSTEGSAFVF